MGKRTPMQVPDELPDRAAAAAQAGGKGLKSLEAEIERARGDDDFIARAKRLLERDREILDQLAE